MRFNNKKAWRELAEPAFMALPWDILQLVKTTMVETRGIQQEANLHLPWPDDSSLYNKLIQLPEYDLACAARIVWAVGHWHSGSDNWLRPLARTGTYWKFANYADQILRDKCDLHSDHSLTNMSFEIHEGFIRACINFDDLWEWHEVAVATPENLKQLKTLNYKLLNSTKSPDIDEFWGVIMSSIQNMKLLIPDGTIGHFFDLTEFEK